MCSKPLGTDSRRGVAAVKVDNALLRIQITLSRAVVFLKEFGATDDATLVEEQLPKRFHHRASDPKSSSDNPLVPPPSPEQIATKDEAPKPEDKPTESPTDAAATPEAEAKK